MRTGMIPLKGRSKVLLRLQEEGGLVSVAVSPPEPGGFLYLVGTEAQTPAVSLDDEGRALIPLPFFPVAALVYDGKDFLLHGGFAGRNGLMEKAKIAVRLQCSPTKNPKPPPACSTNDSAPHPSSGAHLPPPMKAEEAEAASRFRASLERRPQSDALLEALRMAQSLFHGEVHTHSPQQRPSPADEPASIANPFPRSFPQSTWRRVIYPGAIGHYLCGEGTSRSGAYTVYALPGEYSPVPRNGKGFNKFLRSSDGSGYWVRVVRKVNPPHRS